MAHNWTLSEHVCLSKGGIDGRDAARQERTAGELLRRLRSQPGIVLADEVGMGKTFVALAAAASAAWTHEQPAVVMVPPRLVDKWVRDSKRFAERCVCADGAGALPAFRHRVAQSGAEFLKCFDDPPDRRAHLVILANTALHRSERDPWVKLAAIKHALSHIGADDGLRRAVARYAGELIRSRKLATLGEAEFTRLLSRKVDCWRKDLRTFGIDLDDDPVPLPFNSALKPNDLAKIGEALQQVPRRKSEYLDQRLSDARNVIVDTLKAIWPEVLQRAQIESPLLIFDEAHHLKNADTRLAKLFLDPEASDRSVITGAFHRMLFLTATPFQLGHHELLGVLRRFQAIRWESMPEGRSLSEFNAQLEELGRALDRAQEQGMSLDRLWGELTEEDLPTSEQGEVSLEHWQRALVAPPDSGPLRAVVDQYQSTEAAFRAAEELIRPWVARHLRDRSLRTEGGELPRRLSLTGRGIETLEASSRGLEVQGDARFPFLLCARAQGLLARATKRRAYFAEGLASSYGAFLETSSGAGRPTDDADVDLEATDPAGQVNWYVEEVTQMLGKQRVATEHPKVAATVERAVQHWLQGEKVLVFGHYRMTIRDLNDALKERVAAEVVRLGARQLGLRDAAADHVNAWLERVGNRLRDKDSPMRHEVLAVLNEWVADERWGPFSDEIQERVAAQLVHNLAFPSFLVRNFPLDRPEVRASLEADRPTAAQAREAAAAVRDSLTRRRGTGLATYRTRVEAFLRHLAEDLISDEERADALTDLETAKLEPVLHADGGVDDGTRRRRLRGFNSPLLPEILVASEVMAEGLDLHLDCRHVIHHDLSWNPSTLEQRTGRIDRLRCKAEMDGESIHVYLPYLEGTADEKMYRVVSDRARWFQVVMGERYQVDENSTEKLARRLPFPQEAAEALMFRLGVG